jgi:Holliday junction resolvasome RuvABC DNA-binding subunit
VVLFYARRQEIASTKARPKKPKPNRKEKSSLVESLKSLGLTTTNAEVEQAVKEVFPGGTEGKDESEVVTAIFLHLKRRNRGDSVGR